jgi:predicted Fe-Mo cluster-binding NifX family protein
MKIAIPTWRDRVSPVFDVAQQLLLVELIDVAEVSRQQVSLLETDPVRRARRVQDLQVQTLICCAVSEPLREALVGCGVEVIDHICGDVEEIVAAYQNGTLGEERFAMPGCDGHPGREVQRKLTAAEPQLRLSRPTA